MKIIELKVSLLDLQLNFAMRVLVNQAFVDN